MVNDPINSIMNKSQLDVGFKRDVMSYSRAIAISLFILIVLNKKLAVRWFRQL